MDARFHAQHDARGKLYTYRILHRPARPTVDRAFVWHIYRPLNEAAMQQAAATLIGSHDFSSFEASLTGNSNPICHLQRLAVIRHDDQIHIEAYADRFLKHMVRAMVGTVVEVGLGKRTPDSLAEVLKAKDRSAAGQTAPPHGLCLMRVDYE
jgi:tRNA pseudouridine38-40 synthase